MTLPDFQDQTRRGLIQVRGDDATGFLQGILTIDVEDMQSGEIKYGGLLTPQGKILFDFFVLKHEAGYQIDVEIDTCEDLAQRLMFYRLRSKVELQTLAPVTVSYLWSEVNSVEEAQNAFDVKRVAQTLDLQKEKLFVDPRHSSLGLRYYGEEAIDLKGRSFDHHRIRVGIPKSGADYELGSIFPHDALFDEIGAVDFSKGCYVGQEVVSRMKHKTQVRKRFVKVSATHPAFGDDAQVMAGDKSVGTMGSHIENDGLALVRLDRVADAFEQELPITVGGQAVQLSLPDWVNFAWPQTA